MSAPGNAVVRRTVADKVTELVTTADARAYIEPFLPKGTDVQRVAASLLLAIRKDESGMLRKCTPDSLVLGLAKIQQWGLELGEGAFLLPFKNNKAGTVEAVAVRGYIALAELSAACGYPLEVKVVRDGDHFEYRFGLDPVLDHRPVAKSQARITHVWCIIRPPRHGQPIIEVMTIEDVDAIRLKYSKQWKDGPCPAWYAKKTIVRQVVKMLPKSKELARLRQVIEEDEILEVEPELAPTARVVEDGPIPGGDVVQDGDFQDDRDMDDERND
jgi:phage RecT family recombinase